MTGLQASTVLFGLGFLLMFLAIMTFHPREDFNRTGWIFFTGAILMLPLFGRLFVLAIFS